MKTRFEAYQTLLTSRGNLEQKKKDFFQIIDQFYDEEIVQIENAGKPIQGKEILETMEAKNFTGVNSVHIEMVRPIYEASTNLAWGEMIIHMDSKQYGKKRLVEAFHQEWKNGKIVLQKFYYGGMLDD